MNITTPQPIQLAFCGKISLGQSFRRAVREDVKSRHFVLQSRDLSPEGCLSSDLMPMGTTNEPPKTNIAPGDIVVLCRGVRFNAGVVHTLPGPTTAQSMFYIVRLRADCGLTPEYVASFINTPAVQDHLKSLAKGATVQHLKVDDLGSLRIPVPPMAQQRTLVALARAIAEEQKLSQQLSSLRKQQFSLLLNSLTHQT
ncbi:MAG: hypothetical protein JJT75_08575 [Opitutales bacterium]|nr:hypothetical protein [Opitutales bacterium]MCH8539357.1 hypothetical protein [Opitutales bacterium]